MQIEDALERKDPRKMTDDELEAIIWKTQKRLEEMGVEQALTEVRCCNATCPGLGQVISP